MGTYQRKTGPTAYARRTLSNVTMTRRQQKRLDAGYSEGKKSDYDRIDSEIGRILRDARHAVEDIRMARELGIDPP